MVYSLWTFSNSFAFTLALTHFCAVTIPNRNHVDVYIYGGATDAEHAEYGKKLDGVEEERSVVTDKAWSYHWSDAIWRHQPDMMLRRQGHDCITYLINNGETSVALIVGGTGDKGVGIRKTEIYDFAMGQYVLGPSLVHRNRNIIQHLVPISIPVYT